MKQFGTIFRFEFRNYLQNRAFKWTTILFVVIIVLLMFSPRFSGILHREEVPSVSRTSRPIMLVRGGSDSSPEENELLRNTFSALFPDYSVELAEGDLSDLQKAVRNGDAECAFVMRDDVSYLYYVNDRSLYDSNADRAAEGLKKAHQVNAIVEQGVPIAEAATIIHTDILIETRTLGADQTRYFLYTYVMILALYTVIVLYGQMVSMNVATEKSSRAMEMLITSAKPVSMLFGKIFASCLAGFLQLLVIFGSAFLCFRWNRRYWADHEQIVSLFDIPAPLIGYMLLFFVLGFLLYAFLYGAAGSTVSKLEDVNMASLPITLVFILAFILMISMFTSGNLGSTLMKVCSFIPFTSPMAMFTRVAMSTVSPVEIVVSVLILVLSVIGVGLLSAKIYRVGVMLYGNRPAFRKLLRSLK